MTGKGRTGPRERQTMSGIIGEGRDASAAATGAAEETPPAGEAPSAATGPRPVVVDPLSLWKRMLAAAERDFERDDSGVEPTADVRSRVGRDAGTSGDQDEDGG